MHLSLLSILRCPFCNGQLELVDSMFHRVEHEEVHEGILGCHCCIFPVVSGIPVMHLSDAATQARAQIEAGQGDAARRTMCGIEDPTVALHFDNVATQPSSTYFDAVEALGPDSEFRYFLYRFSDPSYIVSHPLVRAVAGTVLKDGGRAIDVCGGSGHLTRALMDLSSPPPVLADLFYMKLWLGRQFITPGCEAVCCDGNGPFPFARGAFRYAMCADAFMYIWTKRQFVQEMLRLVDERETNAPGAVLINNTHNLMEWSPSHGQPLSPEGYCGLFEIIEPRVFAEGSLRADVIHGGPLDLSRRDAEGTLNSDPDLAILASNHPGMFQPHVLDRTAGDSGVFRINPLYAAEPAGENIRLKLKFPSEAYESEFGGCRAYLPEEVLVDAKDLAGLGGATLPPALEGLAEQRVVLNLPRRYC